MDFDNINMEEAEKHLNQRLKHILGDRYEKVLLFSFMVLLSFQSIELINICFRKLMIL